MPLSKSFNFALSMIRDFFPADRAAKIREDDNDLASTKGNKHALMDDSDATISDATITDAIMDDTAMEDDDEAMPELLEPDEQGYTPLSQYDGPSSGGWSGGRSSSTALSSIDISQLETIDLTGGEAPLITTRMVYESYEDEVDDVVKAVDDAVADEVRREADDVVAAAAAAVGMVQMQRVAPAAVEDSSGSDSDIEIFQPRRALLRSSMAATRPPINGISKTSHAADGIDTTMVGNNTDTDIDGKCTRKSASSEDSTGSSTPTSTFHSSLAAQLTQKDAIHVPQVMGKAAYAKTSLLDPFLASPALAALLEEGAYPPEVLWASYLKNNVIALDCSAACDNLRVWLNAHPDRYRNVTRIRLEEVLHHTHVVRNIAGQRRWSVYRPFKLLAKCPNLEYLVLSFNIADLPGFWEWGGPDTQAMTEAFDSRYHMYELMACVPKTLKSLQIDIGVDKRLAEKVGKQVRVWHQALGDYFSVAAREAGWKGEHIAALQMKVEFKAYRMLGG